MSVPDILLVEDNPADVRLTQEVIGQSGIPSVLHVARDGEQALRMLHKEGEYANQDLPDLILLDLNLPRKDGREVLKEIKNDPGLRSIPVIMLTTSKAESDVTTCYDLHANAYLSKPVDLDQFVELINGLSKHWLQTVQLPPKKH